MATACVLGTMFFWLGSCNRSGLASSTAPPLYMFRKDVRSAILSVSPLHSQAQGCSVQSLVLSMEVRVFGGKGPSWAIVRILETAISAVESSIRDCEMELLLLSVFNVSGTDEFPSRCAKVLFWSTGRLSGKLI